MMGFLKAAGFQVDRVWRKHLAVVVGWRDDRTDHDAVGHLVVPVDLRPRQGHGRALGREPLAAEALPALAEMCRRGFNLELSSLGGNPQPATAFGEVIVGVGPRAAVPRARGRGESPSAGRPGHVSRPSRLGPGGAASARGMVLQGAYE